MVFTSEMYPGLRQDEIDLLNAFPTDIPEAELQELKDAIDLLLTRRDATYSRNVDGPWSAEQADSFLKTKLVK